MRSEDLQESLFGALDDFGALQRRQQENLAGGGGLEQVMTWREEHQRGFARLKQCLSRIRLDQGLMGDKAFLARVGEALGPLIAQEEAMREAAGSCRKRLQKQLGCVRKGKKMLRLYSLREGTTPLPKYLSSRT